MKKIDPEKQEKIKKMINEETKDNPYFMTREQLAERIKNCEGYQHVQEILKPISDEEAAELQKAIDNGDMISTEINVEQVTYYNRLYREGDVLPPLNLTV